jgi:hypothetical protein
LAIRAGASPTPPATPGTDAPVVRLRHSPDDGFAFALRNRLSEASTGLAFPHLAVLTSALDTIAAASVGAPAARVAMISVNPTSLPVADPPETLGGLRDRELEMSVHCLRCGRIWFLWDRWFARLIRQYGDLPLVEFARRARCKQCSHRGARIEVTEPLLRAAGWKPRAPT